MSLVLLHIPSCWIKKEHMCIPTSRVFSALQVYFSTHQHTVSSSLELDNMPCSRPEWVTLVEITKSDGRRACRTLLS